MVGAGRAHPRGVEDELQLASHDALAHELRELLGAQRGLSCPLEFPGVGATMRIASTSKPESI